MVIEIYPPHALHEKGQRPENEDSIYPKLSPVTVSDPSSGGLFIVCDGLGGAEKGEEASRIVCDSIAASLRGLDKVYEHDLERALEMAESRIDEYVEAHPDAEGMATTLAMLVFDNDGAKVVHVGDSRVYHLRDGKICFRTSDHSLVNEMVSKNIITAEEAINHPRRNIVSRAIMGRQRPTKMDFSSITDVKPGDYFFLCTDGVLESISDAALVAILFQQNKDEQKILDILERCQQFSRDNFSAYLVKVKTVIGGVGVTPLRYSQLAETQQQDGVLPKWATYLLIVFSILALLMILFSVISVS